MIEYIHFAKHFRFFTVQKLFVLLCVIPIIFLFKIMILCEGVKTITVRTLQYVLVQVMVATKREVTIVVHVMCHSIP